MCCGEYETTELCCKELFCELKNVSMTGVMQPSIFCRNLIQFSQNNYI